MLGSFIKLIIGDLGEKKAYRQMMKRVNALPKDYKFAFKKIQHYMYCVGAPNGDYTIFADRTMFINLVELFEASAADGRQVIDVVGSDVGKFSDEFMSAFISNNKTMKEKINREILERFKKEGR